MQHESVQLQRRVTLNTVILCSFFVTFGLGMLSFAWLELYQLQIENQRLKIDLNQIKEKHVLERQQMEEEHGHLQLENQMLKSVNATLWSERNQLEDLIFHLQSELSLAQKNYTSVAENYKRAATENKHLLLNLNSCQSDKTEMVYNERELHLMLREISANNSWLREELAKERSTAETLFRENQTLVHKNKLLFINISLGLDTNAELSAENVVLQSNLTSCQSVVQQKENENENLQEEMNESLANKTWLHNEMRAEMLEKSMLAAENRILKVNLTFAQNVSTNVSAVNSFLWSHLRVCWTEKQQTTEEKRMLKLDLNETLLNNTLLRKVLTKNRLLSQTLVTEQQLLQYKNQLLQLDLSLAQNKSAKLYVKKTLYWSNITSCQSATQEGERTNRNLKLEFDETQANNIFLGQVLESERLARGRFSEEKHHLRTNLTLLQNINANLSAESSSLHSNLALCQSEKQKEEEENGYLQLELNEAHANDTLLRESLAQERLICKTLTTDKRLLEDKNQLLLFNLSFAQNRSSSLFAEKSFLLTNLNSCEAENQLKEEENRNIRLKLTEALANNTWLRKEFANESLASETLSEDNQNLQANISLKHRICGTLTAENVFLLENLTSCKSEKQDEQLENLDLQSELNKTQSNSTVLRRELTNERLTSETLNAKKQSLKNRERYLLLNLSLAQKEIANVSAENGVLHLELTSCQSDKQQADEENRNLQVNISQMHANNTLLKTQVANQWLTSQTLLEERQPLQANLTLFQNLRANASAENSCLQLSLTSCGVNNTKAEEENRNLQVKLNETIANNTVLKTELDKDRLVTEILSAERQSQEDENQLLLSNLSSTEYRRASLSEEKRFLGSSLTLCQAEKQIHQNESDKLQSRLKETSTWLGDGLAKERLALEKMHEESRDLKAKLIAYQNLNEVLSAEHSVLQSNFTSCEDSRRKLEEHLEKAKVEKDRLRLNLTSCNVDVRLKGDERRNLYLKLNETRANITSLSEELATERLKREPLYVKRQQLNESLTVLEDELAVSNALQSSLTLCQEKLSKLIEENQQMNAKVAQLQWNVTSLNNSIPLLTEDILNLNTEIITSRSTLASEITRNKMVRSVLRSPSLQIDGYCDMDTLRCSNCRVGWEEHNSRCFQMSIQVLTWLGARADCIDKGGDLAVVQSEQDQVFLTNLVAQLNVSTPEFILPAAWIGLDDMREENQFNWVDDKKASLTYWSGANPDNATEHFDLTDKAEGLKHTQGQDCVVIELNATAEYDLTNWNDISCRNKRHYICEAGILVVDRTLVPLKV